MNRSQYNQCYKQWDAAGEKLLTRLKSAKTTGQTRAAEADFQEWKQLGENLEREKERLESAEAFRSKGFDTLGDAGSEPSITSKAKTGAEVNPLRFSDASVRSMYDAITKRQNVSVKAFSTVDGLIPAQLAPYILEKLHENRLLDYLPVQSISAPSYEIIVHNSTSGSPAPTAEGATKPEVVLNTTSQTLTAIKLAAHVGISYESMADYPAFYSYAQTEVMRQIGDVENAQLIGGSGTSGNMTGFLSTSGILTHDASADTGTNVTALDSIEMAIAQLRVGSALAEANLLVVNPASFSAIRRLKNTLGNFLIGDPTEQGSRELFGVRVLPTTSIAAGSGLLLDTTKFGRVLLREGISTHVGQNADDFARNISRMVLEERLVLAVERPSAVLALSNLPTTP